MTHSITATKRSKADKLVTVRANGMVPAVVYGARVENTSIAVPAGDFKKLWKAAGESSAVEVVLDGTKIDALIHEVQWEPVQGFPVHVDFLAIDASKPVEVAVPLEFDGVSPAVKGNLGSLMKVLHELQISALPKDLPHTILVDIAGLAEVDQQILAKDIALPKGVTLVTGEEEVVALIAAQQEEEPAEPAAMDLSSIEVEKKGKKEEEGAPEEA